MTQSSPRAEKSFVQIISLWSSSRHEIWIMVYLYPAFLSSRLCTDSPFLMEIIQIPPVVQHQASRRQGGTFYCIIMWQSMQCEKRFASLQLWSRYMTHRMCQMFRIRCPRVFVWMNIGRLIANNFQETAQKLWSSTFLGGVERVHDVTDKILHLSRKIGISFQCCDFQV